MQVNDATHFTARWREPESEDDAPVPHGGGQQSGPRQAGLDRKSVV